MTSEGTTPAGGDPVEALSGAVARLRKERDGLRRAMRSRAVIEQAKGILAERMGISPEDAFGQLIELSTHSNVKLAELAAAVVAGRSPSPAEAPADDVAVGEVLDRLPRPAAAEPVDAYDGVAEALAEPLAEQRLLTSRIDAAGSYDEIAAAVAEAGMLPTRPDAVVLMLLEPDGALRLTGAHGLPAEARSRWLRVPPIEGLPMVEAIRLRRPLLLGDEDLRERFRTTVAPAEARCLAALPLEHDDRVVGVLELFWTEPAELDPGARAHLFAIAEPCARRSTRLAAVAAPVESTADGDHGPLPLAVGALAEPAVLLGAEFDDDKHVVDFHVEAASPAAMALAGAENLGDEGTLMTGLPRLASRLLVPVFAEVLRTGEPAELSGVYVDPERDGLSRPYLVDLHVTRLWDRLLVACRVHTDAELLHHQLLFTEEVTATGSLFWDARTGRTAWSPGLYRLLGRDPAAGPLGPADAAEVLHADDLAALPDKLAASFAAGETVTVDARGAGPVDGRRFRLTAVPSVDADGLRSITATCQDVTGEQTLNTRLKQTEIAAAGARRRLDSSVEVLQALVGTPPARVAAGSFTVTGTAAGEEAAPAAWYDLVELPDARILLIVGESTGEESAAVAQRLRHAASAYGLIGLTPSALLASLNTLSCRLEPGRATAVTVAVVDPGDGSVSWAAAGQGAIIGCQDRQLPRVSPGALGLPVGAAEGLRYTDNELTLAPGDRIVLYTEGLLTGAHGGRAEALGALLATAGDGDAKTVLDGLREHLDAPLDGGLCLIAVAVSAG